MNETETKTTPKSYRERLLGPGHLTEEDLRLKAEQKAQSQERVGAAIVKNTARLEAVIDRVPDFSADKIGVSVIKPGDVDLSGEFSRPPSPVAEPAEPITTEKWDRLRELVAPEGPDYAHDLRGWQNPDFKRHTPVAPEVSTKHDLDESERIHKTTSDKDWPDFVRSVTG